MSKKQKQLPFNEEAEKVVIGSAISSKDALYKILSILNVDDFYLEKHQLIYQAIINLQAKRLNIDSLTIVEELTLLDKLDEAGGTEYLLDCIDRFISLSALDNYINIVKDNSDLRKFLLTIKEIDDDYKNKPIDTIEDFIKSSQEKIRSSIESSRTSSFKSIGSFTDEAILKSQTQRSSGDGHTTGITCGYDNINRYTNGFQRGEVTVVGARSSVGKTALALNMAYRAAKFGDVPVAIFELEMKGTSLAERMLSMISDVEVNKFTTGNLSELDRIKIKEASNELKSLSIFIDEGTENTVMDIEVKTRQLLDKYPNLGLVVIDHMSIVKTTGGKKSDTRVDEMRKISRALHSLAKELNVAVLAVAQLNRDSVKGEVRRPKMSDIKESGAIEQDADVIILLYDALYENNRVKQNEKAENIRHVEAIVAKNRNGQQGVANLLFLRNYSRYDCPTKAWEEEFAKIQSNMFSFH